LLLAACGTSGGSVDASAPDATEDATVDAVQDVAPDTQPSCGDGSAPPTTSFSLSAWPALGAQTATDWTAMSGVSTVSVPGAPAGVALAKDGGWAFAALGPAAPQLGVLKRSGATLTFDHGFTAPAGETPFGVAQSSDGTLLAMSLSDEIALYDIAKAEANATGAFLGLVTTKSVMKTSIDVAFSNDAHFAFVALEYDDVVAVIDVVHQAYVGAVPIAGDAVTSVVLSPDGSKLYVTCEVSNEFKAANPMPAVDQVVGAITVVDVAMAETTPATAVVGRAFVGRAPVRAIVSADGSTLWVTVRGSNAVLQLDAQNLLSTTCNPLLSTTAVGPAPVGVAFVDNGKAIAIADSNRFNQPTMNQTVMFVSTATATTLGEVTVGAFPREIDTDATALMVSNYDSQSVSSLDPTKLPLP
jgi:DNA-binding beta-propeller fold protein YncE